MYSFQRLRLNGSELRVGGECICKYAEAAATPFDDRGQPRPQVRQAAVERSILCAGERFRENGNEGRQLRAREKGLEVQKNRPRLPKDAASPNLYLMRCSHDSIGLRRGTKRE